MARPGSAGSLGSTPQRVAQYNVPGLRRKRPSQLQLQEPPQQPARQQEQLAPRAAAQAAGAQPAAATAAAVVQDGQAEPGGTSLGLQGAPPAAAVPASNNRGVAVAAAPLEQAGVPLRRSKRRRQASGGAVPQGQAPGSAGLKPRPASPEPPGQARAALAAALAAEGAAAAPRDPAARQGEQEALATAAGGAGSGPQAYLAHPRVREGSQALAQVLAVLQPASPTDSSSGGSTSAGNSGSSSGGRTGSRAAGGSRNSQGAASLHLSREQVMQGSQNLGEVLSLLKPPSSDGTGTATPSPATSPSSGAATAGGTSHGSGSSPGSPSCLAATDGTAGLDLQRAVPCGGTAAAAPAQADAPGSLLPSSTQQPAALQSPGHQVLAQAAVAEAAEAEAAAAALLAAGQPAAPGQAAAAEAAQVAHAAAAAEDVVIPDSQPSPTPLKPPQFGRQHQAVEEEGAGGQQQQACAVHDQGMGTGSPRGEAAEGRLQQPLAVGAALGGESNQRQSQGLDWQPGDASPPPSAAQALPQPAAPGVSPLAGDSNEFAVELSGFTTPTGRQAAVLGAGAAHEAPGSTAASGQRAELQAPFQPTQQ